jgi:hypothetical protein
MLLDCLTVPGWNSESSKLIPHFWVPVLVAPMLRSNLEATAVEIKDLKHKLDHSCSYTILSHPCEACVSLKGKLFRATKENTELQQKVAYLTAHLEKTVLSEKMVDEDLSRVEESETKSTYRLDVGFERYEKKGEKSAPKFVPSFSYHKEEEALKPTKAHYHPIQSHPSTQREKQGKKPLSQERKLLFACFVAVLITWMTFASGGRELRWGVLGMLETHIMMNSLIFLLVLILMFCLAFTLVLLLVLFHVLCLSSLMDLTIAHMVLAHERTALSLDALVITHVLIVLTVSRIGLVFPLEGPSPTLSQDT